MVQYPAKTTFLHVYGHLELLHHRLEMVRMASLHLSWV